MIVEVSVVVRVNLPTALPFTTPPFFFFASCSLLSPLSSSTTLQTSSPYFPLLLSPSPHQGSVKVWDPRQRDQPVACMEPAEGEARRDCWTVAFGEQHHLLHMHCLPINGFHSIFSLGNWRALHHHAGCWLVNIHITWHFCPPVSMVKGAMESMYV